MNTLINTAQPARRYSLAMETAGELVSGLREIAASQPERFPAAGGEIEISFRQDKERPGFRLVPTPSGVEISYARKCDAFRGLGAVVAGAEVAAGECTSFSSLGVMLDVSRNAVLTVGSLKRMFRHFALMGINTVQLYMEDVYEIEGEPFFGYCRGRYRKEELREIDDYGDLLGIEVVPCIQTLGHLEKILQWPAYAALADTSAVLLVDDPGVRSLIVKMLDAVSACFRSRRIHVGMDEAHGIGLGRYRLINGDRKPFDLLSTHLRTVVELCSERGLHPMIWSDMYFRLGSVTDDYYDRNSQIPDDVAAKIPGEVDLVYWDYYHSDPGFYVDWIARHRKLGKEPIFAAGAWCWGRFWTCYPRAFATIGAGMKSAREAGLKEAMLTIWGDDGAEVDPVSILPAVQYFAECAYGSPAEAARRFDAFGIPSWDALLVGGELDPNTGNEYEGGHSTNFGQWVLWHDPLLNFLEKHVPADLPARCEALAERLESFLECDRDLHLEFIRQLARTLALKSRLHLNLGRMYRDRDRAGLSHILGETIPLALDAVRKLSHLHREVWNEWHKPWGWDVLERRYAGLISRLETLRATLEEHCHDDARRIPELEEEPQPLWTDSQNSFFTYARASSSM